jgi:hypothetical protein
MHKRRVVLFDKIAGSLSSNGWREIKMRTQPEAIDEEEALAKT